VYYFNNIAKKLNILRNKFTIKSIFGFSHRCHR